MCSQATSQSTRTALICRFGPLIVISLSLDNLLAIRFLSLYFSLGRGTILARSLLHNDSCIDFGERKVRLKRNVVIPSGMRNRHSQNAPDSHKSRRKRVNNRFPLSIVIQYSVVGSRPPLNRQKQTIYFTENLNKLNSTKRRCKSISPSAVSNSV